MRWIRFSIILLLTAIINTGDMLDLISVGSLHIRPDLLLILMVFFASNCGMFEAVIASFVIGFAADISGSAMGPYTVSFGLFGSLISQLRKVIITKGMLHQCGAIIATGIVAGGFAHMLFFFKTHEVTANIHIALAGTAVYSGIISPFIWLGLSALSRWLGIHRPRLSRPLNR